MSLFQCLSRKWGRGIFPQYFVGFRRSHPHLFMAFLLRRWRENEAKVVLAKIGVGPRETSATVGNNVSYTPGLLRPFLRIPPVI
jgi:hypothetical protein